MNTQNLNMLQIVELDLLNNNFALIAAEVLEEVLTMKEGLGITNVPIEEVWEQEKKYYLTYGKGSMSYQYSQVYKEMQKSI